MDTRLGDVTYRDVSVSKVDTPTILKNAADQAVKRRYEEFCIVDVDFPTITRPIPSRKSANTSTIR